MATAVTSPALTTAPTTVGICVPEDFPESDIRTILTDAGHTVGFSTGDFDDAVQECGEGKVDLFLLGASRPSSEALRCVRALAEACGTTKVILLCERSANGDLRKALDAGVRGFVALDDVAEALPPVIEVVRAGQVSVPGPHSGELRKQVLTAREKQILGLVVMGMTNAEIASKLFLAESTIKSHLSSAFAKLGVSSRSEAASFILDPQSGAGLGILTIPTG